jgi:hypothetical protein
MATLRFYLKPLKNGTAHIMAALQAGAVIKTKYTGYAIPTNKLGNDYKYWDKKKSRVRSHDDAIEINKKLMVL